MGKVIYIINYYNKNFFSTISVKASPNLALIYEINKIYIRKFKLEQNI